MVFEVLQIFLAGYLLLLALSAAWGVHRPLLLLPARSLYSLEQAFRFVGSFGRVRLMPLARRRGLRKRSLRQTVDDFQEIQLSEVRGASWKRSEDEETDS